MHAYTLYLAHTKYCYIVELQRNNIKCGVWPALNVGLWVPLQDQGISGCLPDLVIN